MVRVFISHATHDNEEAKRIYEKLSEAGVRAWLDNVDIDPSVDWLKQVDTAVKESSHGLFLLSPAAVKSPAAMKEYKRLISDNKPLYVALIEDVSRRDLPERLQRESYFDLTEDFDKGVTQLIQVMESGGGAVTPPVDPEQRDITITLQANLRDLDTDKFVDLIGRLVDVGIKDIKVINVSAG
jgi:hypothetical protein